MLTRSIRLLPVAVLAVAGLAVAAPRVDTDATLGLRDRTPRHVALVGATVVVSPTRAVERATLVLRDGVVESIGRDAPAPPGATVFEVAGLRLYPGFVEMLSDYGLGHVGPLNADGGPGPQYKGHREGLDAWNDALHPEIDWADHFRPDAEAAGPLLARGVTVVHAAGGDGVMRGRGVVAALGQVEDGRSGAEQVLRAAGLHVVSFDKGSSPQSYPSSQMGAIALLRQTLLDGAWYRAAGAAAEPNRALAAVATILEADAPVVFVTEDEHALLRAARVAAEFGLTPIHVGSNREFQRGAVVAGLGQAVLLPLRFPDRPEVATAEAARDVTLAALRVWERAPANAADLAARDVPIAFTGAGLGPKDSALERVRTAVRRGLDPADALAALTTTPARLLGVDGAAGTLDVGKRADLIIADGDLLLDDDATIREVWVAGLPAAQPLPLDLADPRGAWRLRAGDATVDISVAGTLTSPRIQAKRGDDSFRAESVALRDDILTFALDLDPLGSAGIGRFRLALGDDEATGVAVLADERPVEATLRRIPADTSDDDGRDEDAARVRDDDSVAPVGRLTTPNVGYGLTEPVAAETVLLRGPTLWTLTGDGRVDDTDLLLRDGRIAAIGPGLTPPRGARVIDAAGLHVTPGMIDEHSHLAIAGGVNEGSHAITAEVRIGDVVDPDDIGIYRALAGGTTAAQLLHGSANPIGGQAQVIKMRWGRSAEEMKFAAATPSIKFALGENVKQSNWGSRFTTRYPQSRMGVGSLMRDALHAARAYGAARSAATDGGPPVRRNLQLDALLEVLEGERLVHCHSYVQSEVLMLIRLAESFGFRIGTFTHILEGYKVAPEIAAHGAGASTFSDWWAYKAEVEDAVPYNTCLLEQAGVVTSINSDSAEVVRRLNQEAGKSVMYCGMDEVGALKLATLNPARQLGIDERVGTLEVGKDADVVLWTGHPLSVHSRVVTTWVDGAPLFDAARDLSERDTVAAERAALIQRVLRSADQKGGADATR